MLYKNTGSVPANNNTTIPRVNNNVDVVTSISSAPGGIVNGTTSVLSTNTNGYSIGPNITVENNPAILTVKGKLMHNGRDLEERLQTIEKILLIPERDVILEKKYPALKEMYDRYLEELAKYRLWEKLKE